MRSSERQQHWDKVYKTKKSDEVSWYQPVPTTSLEFLKEFNLPRTAKIIDVGGGDSFLVDRLLSMGYENITVVDISAKAIEKARSRLGSDSEKVSWIVADAADFQPPEKYDFWHDRATFHFLTDKKEIDQYVKTLESRINHGGYLMIGTFSEQGPDKCSGLDVKQYSEQSLTDILKDSFSPVRYIIQDHTTPSGSVQNFIFGFFKRKTTP